VPYQNTTSATAATNMTDQEASGLTIVELGASSATVREWDEYVSTQRDGTVYHLHAWSEIFRRGFGYQSRLLLAREGVDGPIRGVLPLYRVGTPFQRRFVAVPFRDRGGALWDDREALRALVEHAEGIAKADNVRSTCLKTLVPYPDDVVAALALREQRHWVRSAVDLSGYDEDGLWSAIGDKNRNMVRQAERHGLTCEVIDADAHGVAQWYALYLQTQGRLGLPPLPHNFFTAMCETLSASGHVAVFVVRDGDHALAATIVLLHGSTGIYGYSASSTRGQSFRANDLMLFTTMKWLSGRGYTSFDMGSDSPLQNGLIFFKRKWLAVQSPVTYYYLGSEAPVLDSSANQYAFARSVFKRLPLPVLRLAGSLLTRYLG
jgi:CelD/BcsL family acetyltransferase involved in cellulose biosynthesis